MTDVKRFSLFNGARCERESPKLFGFIVATVQTFAFLLTLLFSEMRVLTFLGVIVFVFGAFLIASKTTKLLSLGLIFYAIVFFFHFSYFILISTDNVIHNVHFFIRLSQATQIDTLRFCILFLFLFPIGFTFYRAKTRKSRVILNQRECYKIGLIIMIICLLPRIYVDAKSFILYLQSGYLNTFTISFNNYVLMLANFFFLGSLLAIVGAPSKKKALLIFLLTAIIMLVGMMSGRRGTKVAYLISIFFVYFRFKSKVSFKKILLITLLAYFGLALIASFGDVRDTGSFSLSVFFGFFKNNLSGGLFIDQMSEFGYAAYTLGSSIEYFPSINCYGYGVNYIASWLEVFPNVGGVLTGFSDEMSFVLKLPSEYQNALGGSLLGEIFYNFGSFSFLFIVLLGYIVSFFSHQIESNANQNGLSFLGLISIMALSPAFLWVRSVFNEFPRTVVWGLLMVFLIDKVFFARGYKHETQS